MVQTARSYSSSTINHIEDNKGKKSAFPLCSNEITLRHKLDFRLDRTTADSPSKRRLRKSPTNATQPVTKNSSPCNVNYYISFAFCIAVTLLMPFALIPILLVAVFDSYSDEEIKEVISNITPPMKDDSDSESECVHHDEHSIASVRSRDEKPAAKEKKKEHKTHMPTINMDWTRNIPFVEQSIQLRNQVVKADNLKVLMSGTKMLPQKIWKHKNIKVHRVKRTFSGRFTRSSTLDLTPIRSRN